MSEYAPIRCAIREVQKSAVMIDTGFCTIPIFHWVPRSLVHPDDDAGLSATFSGEVRTLRIARWKADALGLSAAGSDGATGDLFQGDRT